MTTIPIRIILHGLLVLVPTPNTSDHITALLADSTTADQEPATAHAHDPMCDSVHHPMLLFRAKNSADCRKAGCTSSGKQCICQDTVVIGRKFVLDVQPLPSLPNVGLPNDPLPGLLPKSAAESGSFAYVANLSRAPFGLSLDQSYLSNQPPPFLATRVDVPFSSLTSCSLAKRDDGGVLNIHEMSFRKLNDPSREDDISQALAQRVVASLEADASAVVKLVVSNFDGSNSQDVVLEPADYYRIEVSNNPLAPLDLDHPCNDGIARHFGSFYKFSTLPNAVPILPHARPTKAKNPEEFTDGPEPKVCEEPVFGLIDRPICPIATFNP